MSTNMDLLKEKMRTKNVSIDELAKALNIDVSTFYRKLKSNGENFTVGQIHKIVEVLNLSNSDASAIFLWQISQ